MQYTDTQLKQALAKMLPDVLIWDDKTTQHNTDRPQDEGWGLCWDSGNPVLDTELLHLCWLVEETLTKQWHNYVVALAKVIARAESNEKVSVPTNVLINATWQQRTIALAKVKGIEIV